ncbi:hypothetical protein XENOCAPTIV_009360 [Xenoophorus captivus]|uniref:Uncharacterized protein n=1 Tax=Xenoophorus captivus TaxID=1517983 RepID=A0ABV0QC11_9TELE
MRDASFSFVPQGIFAISFVPWENGKQLQDSWIEIVMDDLFNLLFSTYSVCSVTCYNASSEYHHWLVSSQCSLVRIAPRTQAGAECFSRMELQLVSAGDGMSEHTDGLCHGDGAVCFVQRTDIALWAVFPLWMCVCPEKFLSLCN